MIEVKIEIESRLNFIDIIAYYCIRNRSIKEVFYFYWWIFLLGREIAEKYIRNVYASAQENGWATMFSVTKFVIQLSKPSLCVAKALGFGVTTDLLKHLCSFIKHLHFRYIAKYWQMFAWEGAAHFATTLRDCWLDLWYERLGLIPPPHDTFYIYNTEDILIRICVFDTNSNFVKPYIFGTK